ncbi:gamma-glutamyltransferase [Lihuaxuella thermophila]|uniref:Glutathione hydrolase proenzyme n=1 Tax=Lihuaxuella thermophila TaxID=1173111 RepID=A0A1H8E8N4_9BACL|nr:gamma-glutamyltransferase [Lihuaxuella thermophila]SEN15138.1 gamma-glutamyltranspeptidase / glutathione hydrolase [Lihuaxuella thermophila]
MLKRWKSVCALLFSLFLLLFSVAPVVQAHPSVAMKQSSSSPVATGNAGMVVTAHPLASKVGADVLARGGNAVDAAVAIQFALNVTEPMMSGIGGGGFMMVYDAKTKKVSIIDSRERAPASAHPRMFLDENGKEIPFEIRSTRGYAVGVPGTLKGLQTALNKWGTRPMAQLIEPAIRLAEKGVPVNWVLARDIHEFQDRLSPEAKKVFVPGGNPLKEGDLLVQKDLAKTFRLIQSKGVDAFYKGPIGQALVKAVNEKGGNMQLADLKRYQVTEDAPIWGEYEGYRVATMPPPSSGGVTMLQILKLLDKVDAKEKGVRSADKYHLFTEAMHLAYADRGAYLGDPEFVDMPLKGLLDPRYIEERAALIDPDKANPNVKPGDPWKYEGRTPAKKGVPQDHRPGQTTHFTVADRWGNLVSYTTTIEQEFGTGIMVPGYGFLLNNELTDFDAIPGGPNEVQPNKRPRSSMTPTIVFKDGKPVMTVGSPGGSTIIASVFQVMFNKLSYGMSLKDAIEEPRIFSSSYPNIRWEQGVPDEVRAALAERGHSWESSPTEIGNVNALWIDHKTGNYLGAGDSSRESTAIGLNRR